MRQTASIWEIILLICLASGLGGCAAKAVPVAQGHRLAPDVELKRVEVSEHTGFFYYSSKVPPTHGKPGNRGAPMVMDFVFDITNPNPDPVMLESIKFSVYFENFEVKTTDVSDASWIPGGKINRIRIPVLLDARQVFLSLVLPEAPKLIEMKASPREIVEKWWTGAPSLSYPISVKNGGAVFRINGSVAVIPFEAVYP